MYYVSKVTGEGYDNKNDGYEKFEQALVERFNSIVSTNKNLFMTDAEGLFEAYLSGFPAGGARQHYNCNCCEHFIEKFGGLVVMDDNGAISSPLWDEDSAPAFFKASVKAMKKIVLKAKVTGIFLSSERNLGNYQTENWTHLHAVLPKDMVYRNRLLTDRQAMAEKREEHGMLVRACMKFSAETIDKTIELLESGQLYRGDRFLATAKFFKEVKDVFDNAKGANKHNLMWLKVARAHAGATHINSGAIGTLLSDVEEGKDFNAIKRAWESVMSPDSYQRSQSAPTENAVENATKRIQDLGLEGALRRKYAQYEEIPEFIWQSKGESAPLKAKDPKAAGPFANIATKNKSTVKVNDMNIPATVMTYEKFARTILPTADSIEALIDNPDRLMALVTAADPEAENILLWNNPFSWYYKGGVDAEIKRRVTEAGGRYEDNEIRVSLLWDGTTDLDLHCITPRGNHIYYRQSERKYDNGYLDIDANGIDGIRKDPVENMRWANSAPQGHYKFYVKNYNERENMYNGTPFKVELEVNGKTYHYEGKPLRDSSQVTVFEFDYVKGQDIKMTSIQETSVSSNNEWTVDNNNFVKVKGITKSPNLWGKEPLERAGDHTFFILEDCKDMSEGTGRGFFNEMLIPELKDIRKVLEAYTASTPIEDAEKASACGLGFSKDGEWNVTLKVTSGGTSKLIKIDRLD